MKKLNRIRSALVANATAQVIAIGTQLLSLPIFLSFWTLEKYGAWVILTAVPAYFSLADFGFLAVTINKMTMLGDEHGSQRVRLFQTALALFVGALSVSALACLGFVAIVDLGPLAEAENKLALVLLVLCAVLAMSNGLVDAVFRSSGEYALGAQLVNGARLVEWGGMICGLFAGRTILSTAMGQLTGRLIGSFLSFLIASRRYPQITWGFSHASGEEFKRMVVPALSFLAFPVGNALNFQGVILISGAMFGEAFVAMFSAYRTITRLMAQIANVVARSLAPTISMMFGRGEGAKLMQLYHKAAGAIALMVLVMAAVLLCVGDRVVGLWSSGGIPYDSALFQMLVVAAVVNSLWQMGITVLSSTNEHVGIAAQFLVAAVLSISLIWAALPFVGANAPALAMIAFEIAMVFVCALHLRRFSRAINRVVA